MARMSREERQIRQAFIDGYKTGVDDAGRAPRPRTPEQAWNEDNTTERPPRRERPPLHPSNRRIGDPPGGSRTYC